MVEELKESETVLNDNHTVPEAEPEQPKSRIIIRQARQADMPQLEDLLIDFYEIQRRRGNKTLAKDPNVLRGGVMVELSMNFVNPSCRILVADKETTLLGFFIGEIVNCRPIEEYHKALWVRGDYVDPKLSSLIKPIILQKMWGEIKKWSLSQGVSYFFGDIHQSNQASIKTAKSVGFKHHMTRFLLLANANGGSQDGRE